LIEVSCAWDGQSAEYDVPALLALRKDQKGWNGGAAVSACVGYSKRIPQYEISAPASPSIVKLEARPAVIAVIVEEAILVVDLIWPIRFRHRCVKNNQFGGSGWARKAKPTLIARSG
jgi:hypothetical protein